MRELGKHYTQSNVWYDDIVRRHIDGYKRIVDPFAGGGDILRLFGNVAGFDIDPATGWTIRDSLLPFARGHAGDVCITNPPYLARNSAKRRGIDIARYFAGSGATDLYQVAIERCLAAFDTVVMIVPESFLLTGRYTSRLSFVNVIEERIFDHTDCPVAVAGWSRDPSPDFEVYRNGWFMGSWGTMRSAIPCPNGDRKMIFNAPAGALGIVCVDSIRGRSIKFCAGEEIAGVDFASRSKTRVEIEGLAITPALIRELNLTLGAVCDRGSDLLLTPFYGLTRRGWRRRRLSYTIARAIINRALDPLPRPEIDLRKARWDRPRQGYSERSVKDRGQRRFPPSL